MWASNNPEDLEEKGVSEHTGFPNAGTDSSLSSLDLAKLLIKNPSSTFFMRVRGHHWSEKGIFDSDVVVIDRVLVPSVTDLVIWWQDESFALGKPRVVPEDTEVWGVVTYVIHEMRQA
jgi:DNA polymerase V